MVAINFENYKPLNERQNGDLYEHEVIKDGQTFIFRYSEKDREKILTTIGEYASNPNFSLMWPNVIDLREKIQHEK